MKTLDQITDILADRAPTGAPIVRYILDIDMRLIALIYDVTELEVYNTLTKKILLKNRSPKWEL